MSKGWEPIAGHHNECFKLTFADATCTCRLLYDRDRLDDERTPDTVPLYSEEGWPYDDDVR
jgi:hypothetical protein